MLKHLANRAGNIVSSPPTLSSCPSIVAMVMTCASILTVAVHEHRADRAEKSSEQLLDGGQGRGVCVAADHRRAFTHRADRADAPIWSPPSISSSSSMVAMIAVSHIAPYYRRAHAHSADRVDTPIVPTPALSSVTTMLAVVVTHPSLLIAAVITHCADPTHHVARPVERQLDGGCGGDACVTSDRSPAQASRRSHRHAF